MLELLTITNVCLKPITWLLHSSGANTSYSGIRKRMKGSIILAREQMNRFFLTFLRDSEPKGDVQEYCINSKYRRLFLHISRLIIRNRQIIQMNDRSYDFTRQVSIIYVHLADSVPGMQTLRVVSGLFSFCKLKDSGFVPMTFDAF
jgi:hypothetical protein